jgi:TonB dependent receptor/Carboxypeptidase regulatory-like domain/TonB-dependent Receptor Plug Domain
MRKGRSNMKRRNLLIAAAALAAVAGVAENGAHGQSATAGAIQGVVSDKASGEALAGVTVVATSPALQGTQSALTEANGFYKITNLPPGAYVVTFYYSSVTLRRTDVVVNANRTTPVYGKLDTAQAAGEVIEIRGTPNVDVTSTTQGVTLDREYTRNIPVPGNTYEDALGAAAGSAGDGLGVSFSGSTSLENQYIVDGLNTTGLTFGTVGSPVINEFIEEIEIITGGYQAEYGRATGGVVNVVTKTGSNEFHGSVFTKVTSDLIAKDPTRNPTEATSIDATATLNYAADMGFDLGGPIIKDKLWFYVGFSPSFADTKIDRVTKRRTDCRMLQPNGQLSECNPDLYEDGTPDEDENGFLIYEDIPGGESQLNQQGQQYNLVSKISYALAPEHQGQVSLSGNAVNRELIGVFGEQPATSFDQSFLTSDLAAKWTSKFNGNKTEVETVVGWHRDKFESGSIDGAADALPRQNLLFGNLGTWGLRGYESAATVAACSDSAASGDPYSLIENCPDNGVGYRIGGPGGLADDEEQRLAARLSATQRVKAFGNHEIKVGADVEQNLLNKPRAFSGDAYYDVWIGNSESQDPETERAFLTNTTQSHRWVEVAPRTDDDPRFDQNCGPNPYESGEQLRCQFLGPTDVEGNTFNWSAYLRDSWQILPNLTFNAGVRYEEQYLRYAKHLQGSPDPFTLEPRGKNAMEMRNMWAPRIGLLYDWTREGRSKVYASYGRFYESIPMDINDRSFGGEVQVIQDYDHNAEVMGKPVCGAPDPTIGAPPGPNCSGEPEDIQTFGASGVLVAPGLKPQYLDEIIVGSEYEVIEDLKVGLSYQRRTLGRVIEDVSVDGARTYILANPGEFPSEEARKLEAEIDRLMASGDPGDASEAVRKQDQLDQFRGIRIFDKPQRDYNALQLTATKRFSRNFFMQGSYTYSRTTGNFPGLFSADNGQVDPNITSQYDLIELLANRDGPLPQDRPHYVKLDGYYTFDFDKIGEFTAGGRFRALSGVAHEALARHHAYGVDEAFLLPRGEMGRVDPDWTLDAHFGYARELGRGMKLEVYTDFFGLPTLIRKEGVFSVDETYTFDAANPVVDGDYEDLIWVKATDEDGNETSRTVLRNRNFGNPAGRYTTFFTRLGARLTF